MDEFLLKAAKSALLALTAAVIAVTSVSCINIKMGGFGESTPDVEDRSVLILEANGPVTECDRGGMSLNALSAGGKTTLLDMIYSLKKAAVDERIEGVIVKFGGWSVGWAQAADLRDAIKNFRDSGKPAYAFAMAYDNKEYYIAAACDKVYLMPQGMLALTGVSGRSTYIKNLLGKIGVDVDCVRIGKYKTAPEMFTEAEMTSAQEEQVERYLDSIYTEMLSGISKDRKLGFDQLKNQIEEGMKSFTSGLIENGLIDGFMNYDEITALFEHSGTGPVTAVSHLEYQKIPSEDLGLNEGPEVALIFATGSINQGKDSTNFFSGNQGMGSDTMSKFIRSARLDNDIRAIVLRVDSPGGDGFASEAILRELALAKKSKPVVVSMGNYAASGGYYISVLADRIIAQPATLTGSIGVFFATYNMKNLYEKIGINHKTIKKGKYSDLFDDSRSATFEEKELGMHSITDFYNRFIQIVAEGRKTTPEKIDSIAQGRIWSGSDALQNGLIDELGGLDTAIEQAKSLAKIPAKQQIKIILYPARKNLFETMLGGEGNNTVSLEILNGIRSGIPAYAREILGCAGDFINEENSPVLAMLPFILTIN